MKKLIPSMIISIIMGIVLLNSVMLSGCNQGGSNPIIGGGVGGGGAGGGGGGTGAGGGGGAGNIIGKVANNFGTQLNRDVDRDGDNDSAVVLNNIAGGNDDDVWKFTNNR